MPPPLPPDERGAFQSLKARLRDLWVNVFPNDDEPYTSVVVPSVTTEAADLERHPERQRYEETLLFFLIRLRNPRAHLVFVTSQPIPPGQMDYYLHFLAGIPASHAAQRLTLLSPQDASCRPLVEKILERPRLIERIRAAIPDPSRAYLTVFRSTAQEQRLALRLDIPLNAADPGADLAIDKSGAREILREADVEVVPGCERLHDEAEVLDALEALRRDRPGLRRAVLKLNGAYWDEGHALLSLPAGESREDLRAALRNVVLSAPDLAADAYFERFARSGGIVEEFMEAPDRRAASVQVRISPLGQVSLTSTHDELRGGATGMDASGCRFPADDAYRARLQEAGLRVGRVLAARGLTGRVSVEFVVTRSAPDAEWTITGSGINLGVGGTTHPLLAVRFLAEGSLDPLTGLFHSGMGRCKYYRATDHLQRDAYRGLLPEDLIEFATLHQLHYSPQTESGALFYMLGALSEYGRVGMLAVGNSRAEADAAYERTITMLDRLSAAG